MLPRERMITTRSTIKNHLTATPSSSSAQFYSAKWCEQTGRSDRGITSATRWLPPGGVVFSGRGPGAPSWTNLFQGYQEAVGNAWDDELLYKISGSDPGSDIEDCLVAVEARAKEKGSQFPSGSELLVRRFEPHQGMIKAEKPARFKKNILLKLERMEGPLSKMVTWMHKRVRVRVYARKEKGVRGYCTGYVEMFDKHWNMALSDVYESWKCRKYRYSENKLCSLGEAEDCSELLRKMGIDVPEVSVKSVDRKYVMCSRKVPKLLVRGEQVVLVTPDAEEDVGKQ